MQILIIGAGGHGQVVADVLLRARDHGELIQPIGYLDDDPALQKRSLLGLPVLGPLAQLETVAHDAVVIAIGDNKTRQRLFEELETRGERLVLARHPSAIVAPDAQIGPGTMVCAGVVINPGCMVGANVILNTGCTVDHHNRVGDHVHIAPGVHMGGEVTIGEGALVGIGATVMPGCQLGAWSVIGAGAVVVDDIPGGMTAVGLPARGIDRGGDS